MDAPITKRERRFPTCSSLRFGLSALFPDCHECVEPLEGFVEHAFSLSDDAPLLLSLLLLHYMNDSVVRNFPKLARRSAILCSPVYSSMQTKQMMTCMHQMQEIPLPGGQ
jgi:hypothetical protein